MITQLPRAPLGRTDMIVSRVGIGAWALGGGGWAFAWGDQADSESVAAIHRALDAGVNWIDTAAVYGLGHAEEVVARALEGIPAADRPYIFTKGGLVWDERDRSREARRVGNPASLRLEVEASLRRLRVDRIDLYQMHWPADDVALEVSWPVLQALLREGTVRAVGLSNHDVAQPRRAEAIGHVDSLQPPFSLIHRDAAVELLPWCAANGTGVIVYSPMASGLLTGAFTRERALELGPGDWRSRDPDFQEPRLAATLALVEALRGVAARHGVPVAEVAVAWTLAFPGVTGAIVGARRPEQVDGWLPAAQLTLAAEDLDTIAAALRGTGAGSGPERPPGGAG